MCFNMPTPKMPAIRQTPDKNNDEARRRRTAEETQAQQQQGRNATIISSPLGDPGYGENIRRTRVSGF